MKSNTFYTERNLRGFNTIPPSIPVFELIEIIIKIFRTLGREGFLTTFAEVVNTSSKSSKLRHILGVLRKLRFIEVHSDRFFITDTGALLATTDNPDERREIVYDALTNLAPLNYLWSQYGGTELPSPKTVTDDLSQKFSLSIKLAANWVEYFLQTGIYSGYITRNGKAWLVIDKNKSRSARDKELNQVNNQIPIPNYDANVREKSIEQALSKLRNMIIHSSQDVDDKNIYANSYVEYRKLLSNEEKIIIKHPDKLNLNDVEIIKKILKAVELSLDAFLTPS